METVLLPDGRSFPFWDDATPYARAYHVAQHPDASDDGDGSAAHPFRTITRAAQAVMPGEKVVVHAGVYRECVRPVRGGTGPDAMIAFEAAPGETVVVSAAEHWVPDARPSTAWSMHAPANGATVWAADLPEEAFGAYNPFLARNAYDYLIPYGQTQDTPFMRQVLLRRGMVLYQGAPLRQVAFARDLAQADGTFWVEEPGTRLHFRLPGDVPPGEALEITVREQTFAPRERGLGYIRVSGFTFRHAADGLPVPQRASVSTGIGHHWIIEDCHIAWANGCGMSIGCESWDAVIPAEIGRHIIRRNTVTHCGVCGIAGALGVHESLIEGNVIEHIGFQHLERMYECAGIKFHLAEHSLIRGNVIRHIRDAAGLWLDYENVNNRVTGNVFADIATVVGAVYSEMNFQRNQFDGNIIWDVRVPDDAPDTPGIAGSGLRCDCNENVVVAHNLFGHIAGEAIAFTLVQADRKIRRTGLCRANTALNNVLFACPHRVHLGRREANVSDGNLFDAATDSCSFFIAHPEPANWQDLAGWQHYFDLDAHSTQARMQVAFDPDTLCLTWRIDGPAPTCQPYPLLHGDTAPAAPGPFPADAWAAGLDGGTGEMCFM
jgi:hypothetical protein